MKNLLVFFGSALLLLFVSSCSKDIQSHSSTRDQLLQHSWTIQYSESGQDLSGNFASYILLFGDNGSVVVKNADEMFIGKWNLAEKAGVSSLSLQLASSNSTVEKLNATWDLQQSQYRGLSFKPSGGDQELTLRRQ